MKIRITPRLATIVDQAIVSAAGFLTMLFFARTLSVFDWATISYAAGISLVLQGIQINAVTIPMISFCRGQGISFAQQQDWTWLNRAVLLALLGASVVTGVGIIYSGPVWIGESFLYAALLLPPIFSYEYLRRRLILLEDFQTLLAVSIAYALGVALGVGLSLLFPTALIFAALSFWPGMALSSFVSRLRDPIRFSAPSAIWFMPLRAFAPAAVGSSLAGTGYNFAVLAILGAMGSPASVAIFNATRLFVQPINSLVGAFNSLDIPRAAIAYAGGGKALLKTQIRALVRLLVVGGPYILVVCLLAETFLTILFGDTYKSAPMVWAWSLVGLAMLLATPAEIVFYVTRQTRLLFVSKLVASLIACSLAYWSIPQFGAVGAVLSVAAGWMISFLGGAITLFTVRARPAQGETQLN